MLWAIQQQATEEGARGRQQSLSDADYVSLLEREVSLLRQIKTEQGELNQARGLHSALNARPASPSTKDAQRQELATSTSGVPQQRKQLPIIAAAHVSEQTPSQKTGKPEHPIQRASATSPPKTWQCPLIFDVDTCSQHDECCNCFCEGLVHDTRAKSQEECSSRCNQDPYCSVWQWGSQRRDHDPPPCWRGVCSGSFKDRKAKRLPEIAGVFANEIPIPPPQTLRTQAEMKALHLLQGVDIYVIELPHRRGNVVEQAERHGVPAEQVHSHPATTPNTTAEATHIKSISLMCSRKAAEKTGWQCPCPTKPKVVSCTYSHLSALIAACSNPNHRDLLLVLEDDANFEPML